MSSNTVKAPGLSRVYDCSLGKSATFTWGLEKLTLLMIQCMTISPSTSSFMPKLAVAMRWPKSFSHTSLMTAPLDTAAMGLRGVKTSTFHEWLAQKSSSFASTEGIVAPPPQMVVVCCCQC